jgi:F-type H+-transporting ATPase subunit b
MQTSEIISVNIWQIVVSLLNLLLLFLILKKFLFKPVKNVLQKRQDNVDATYAEAKMALDEASASKKELEARLSEAQLTADGILQEATVNAERRRERIVSDASKEAESIIRQAKADAELERKKAEDDIKAQIIDVSGALAEKLIERELKTEDHKHLIDSFISDLGEINDEK